MPPRKGRRLREANAPSPEKKIVSVSPRLHALFQLCLAYPIGNAKTQRSADDAELLQEEYIGTSSMSTSDSLLAMEEILD